jgi:hypothetical protein
MLNESACGGGHSKISWRARRILDLVKMDPALSHDLDVDHVSSVEIVDSEDAKAADLALQEQLIRDITSDDLQVLLKLGFKTVLKPHQKVFAISETLSLHSISEFSCHRMEFPSR